jgi:hypothetical protein
MNPPLLAALALALGTPACTTLQEASSETARVAVVLDAWHEAASEADEERYFGAMAPESFFLGTDASERWSREEFRAYAEPHFSQGRGWTYRPFERHIAFSPDGRTAWVDEKLANDKYGELRGTGVLLRGSSGWAIAHYSMSFPLPNDMTLEVVELLRAAEHP